MEFTWRDYQNLAIELALRDDQAALRTALSRAYYFVFHVCRDRLTANGFEYSYAGDSHKQVWEKYSASPDFACKKIAEDAKRLKLMRDKADYDAVRRFRPEEVTVLVALASTIVEAQAALPSRLPRPH